jgi:hypothetical protein
MTDDTLGPDAAAKVDKVVHAFFDELARQSGRRQDAARLGLPAVAWILAHWALKTPDAQTDAMLAELAKGVRINKALMQRPEKGARQ